MQYSSASKLARSSSNKAKTNSKDVNSDLFIIPWVELLESNKQAITKNSYKKNSDGSYTLIQKSPAKDGQKVNTMHNGNEGYYIFDSEMIDKFCIVSYYKQKLDENNNPLFDNDGEIPIPIFETIPFNVELKDIYETMGYSISNTVKAGINQFSKKC